MKKLWNDSQNESLILNESSLVISPNCDDSIDTRASNKGRDLVRRPSKNHQFLDFFTENEPYPSPGLP